MIYLHLFTMFFRVGAFSFGGGMAMLPLIFQSVQDFGIMTSNEFSDLVAISQVTPGPIAVNAATYVGLMAAGIPGALVSTMGVCLPSFAIMLIVCRLMDRFKDNRALQGAFFGIRPVTVGLIGSAVIFVSETVLINGTLISKELFTVGLDYFNFMPIIIFGVTVVLVGMLKWRPIVVMIVMGVAGAVLCG
ncbi:MAG: chromate transporter [Clostridiales bacterium]|nr:chromate transporter [Clostridiales bacterium]